ncbi:MAG: NAD(P)-dependent dehydrogenase (short-subunit alcohol dehydrogenase family) [Acidimicrobiales bacterium]|jgi:NAD(P)-dependent dehydrogenase (short-subunit alcohol dehydrogenase family)
MKTLKDRVAVITGAGSGIGRALALGYAAEGCKIVVADVQADARDETVALLMADGVEAIGVHTDVTDAESVEALATATIDRFGAVHIVCNNAGVGGGGLIKDQQLVDWKWVIDVCLWGVIHGVHSFLPHLRQQEEAHIMSTASVAGLMATTGLGPYNAAKYGVVATMETLHLEMDSDTESNVGVSVLCPGVVNTNIITAQRNRPDHLKRQKKTGAAGKDAQKRNAAIAAALANGMQPADVAACVIDANKNDQFWVLSHPEHLDDIRHRNESLHSLTNPTIRTSITFGD